ncbi:MAG: trypsin-like peptidase domain-containing protein [Oscillospiraceae bacterium]|nr:trypsin-like peptidase domain-containing protein [Oscillospiraceae bacterium]
MFDQNNQNNQNQTPRFPQNTQPRQPYAGYYEQQPQQEPSNYVNYYNGPEPQKKSGKGGRAFLKVVAGVAALAIVSVSSVEMYKLFGRGDRSWSSAANSEITASLTDESSVKSADADSTADADSSSADSTAAVSTGSSAAWISMAAPEGALTIPEIVEKALPSVVGISSTFEYTQSGGSYWGFGFYGYDNGSGNTQQITGTGTGIVMSEDGYIITNAHCIYDDSEYQCGKAVAVSVVMGDEDETEYEAQIIGYDLETDLAVLKINATGLTPAEFGDSDALSVGELVVAIGNPLGFELFGTTTCGIVSALNRNVNINEKEMTLIQTDAAINQGNSGGPLLNAYGQVIGINSAKMSSSYGSASVEGLGFAIPISDAKEIIESLINNGYVTGRPQLGITGVDVTESDAERFSVPQGVYVYNVTSGSAADEAGLRQGDVITAIEGTEITTTEQLNEVKNQYNAGDTIELTVYRAGETLTLPLTLQEVKQEG